MKATRRLLIAVSVLNVACAAVSVSQLPRADAAAAGEISEVLRTRQLQVVDASGHVRASIIVHPAKAGEEEAVVLRLVNVDGRPGVKLAISQTTAGLALIDRQGDYLQVFGGGIKVTKDHRERATWP
jgi:hypothetical protein